MATQQIPDAPGFGRGVEYVGDVDPGAVGAFSVWLDTSGPSFYVRNAANDAWVAAGGAAATPALGAVLTVGADATGHAITGLTLTLAAADPHVAGRIWSNAGVLTRSAG